MDRKQETIAIKQALAQNGFKGCPLSVRHGTGTAWGWLRVKVTLHQPEECNHSPDSYSDYCPGCRKIADLTHKRCLALVVAATGRSAYSAERIGIEINFEGRES